MMRSLKQISIAEGTEGIRILNACCSLYRNVRFREKKAKLQNLSRKRFKILK